jgi:hypothetical protein
MQVRGIARHVREAKIRPKDPAICLELDGRAIHILGEEQDPGELSRPAFETFMRPTASDDLVKGRSTRDFIKSIDQVAWIASCFARRSPQYRPGQPPLSLSTRSALTPARQEPLKWLLEQFGLKKPRPGLGAMAGATTNLLSRCCPVRSTRKGQASRLRSLAIVFN